MCFIIFSVILLSCTKLKLKLKIEKFSLYSGDDGIFLPVAICFGYLNFDLMENVIYIFTLLVTETCNTV